MHARADHRHRAAVAVIRRIDDELIIERHGRGQQRERIIGLDDLFGSGMWQYAVADQDAESSVIEELPVHAGNAVDDSSKTQCIVRPTPLLALERDPRSDGPVDIGNLKWFDI